MVTLRTSDVVYFPRFKYIDRDGAVHYYPPNYEYSVVLAEQLRTSRSDNSISNGYRYANVWSSGEANVFINFAGDNGSADKSYSVVPRQ